MPDLHIDTELLPLTITTRRTLTADEFEAFAIRAGDVRMEQTKEGTIMMMSPTGGHTGRANSEINFQLYRWFLEQKKRSGAVFDSSTNFRLPDGSTRSPDASYVSEPRLRGIDLKGFPKLCPDFVIELRSPRDNLKPLEQKMEDWIRNGAELAWLIDPDLKQVLVYRPAAAVETRAENQIHGQGPVAGFVLDMNRVWECYL